MDRYDPSETLGDLVASLIQRVPRDAHERL
jgi:hypothetical protein